MKITQLMLSKGFGGGERYFVDLAVSLAARGHDVQAVCHRRFSDLHRLEGHCGIRVDTVNSRGMWDLWSLRELRRRVAAFAPEVMHSHMARAAWAGSKVAKAHAFPLVATTHNYVDLKYYRHVHSFVATTADQARYLRTHGIPPDRVHTIPNFSSFAPVAAIGARGAGPVRFVSYGRMVAKKGFVELLQAMAELRGSGIDCSLLLGGDGPDLAATRALAADLGVGEHVELAGWIDDVAAFLARGDVFVLPSRDEPFGIVMLEAMATGRPIVTTRTKGPSEVLDDDTAWFAEIGDAHSLALAMRSAATDPEGCRARAETALARYRERYHDDAVVPRLVELYADVARG